MGLAKVLVDAAGLDKRSYYSYYYGNCDRQCPSDQYVNNSCRCSYKWEAWNNQGKWIFAGCFGGGILGMLLIVAIFKYKGKRLLRKPLYVSTTESPWKKPSLKPKTRKSKSKNEKGNENDPQTYGPQPTLVVGTQNGGYNTEAAQEGPAGDLKIPAAYGQPQLR